jgi:hypothetical protein
LVATERITGHDALARMQGIVERHHRQDVEQDGDHADIQRGRDEAGLAIGIDAVGEPDDGQVGAEAALHHDAAVALDAHRELRHELGKAPGQQRRRQPEPDQREAGRTADAGLGDADEQQRRQRDVEHQAAADLDEGVVDQADAAQPGTEAEDDEDRPGDGKREFDGGKEIREHGTAGGRPRAGAGSMAQRPERQPPPATGSAQAGWRRSELIQAFWQMPRRCCSRCSRMVWRTSSKREWRSASIVSQRIRW